MPNIYDFAPILLLLGIGGVLAYFAETFREMVRAFNRLMDDLMSTARSVVIEYAEERKRTH